MMSVIITGVFIKTGNLGTVKSETFDDKGRNRGEAPSNQDYKDREEMSETRRDKDSLLQEEG